MKKARNIQIYISGAFLAIVTIFVVAWEVIAFPISDDFFYMTTYCERDGFTLIAEGELIVTLSQALSSFWEHYLFFNSRFTHFFVYLSNLVPFGFYSVICGLMVMAMFILVIKHVGGGIKSPLLMSGGMLLLWVVLPWDDWMVSKDYQVNYVWSSVLCLLFLWFFRKNNEGLTKSGMAFLMLLGVVAGWMHEGFSVPICFGLLWVLVTDRRNRRLRFWLSAAFVLGALLCVGPGTILRVGRLDTYYSIDNLSYFWSRAVVEFIPGIMAISSVLIAWLCLGWNGLKPLMVKSAMWLVVAIIGYVMGWMMMLVGRVFWISDLSFVIVTLIMLRGALKFSSVAKYSIASVFMIVNVGFLVSLCVWQSKFSVEQKRMAEDILARKVELSADMPLGESAPWWTLNIPQRVYANDFGYSLQSFTNYYGRVPRYIYPVINKADCGKPFGEWKKVPGDNSFRGEYPMMYSRDSIPCYIRVKFGKATDAMSPLNRGIMSVTGKSEALVHTKIVRVESNDSAAIYQYVPWYFPRSLQGREVLAIDILPK